MAVWIVRGGERRHEDEALSTGVLALGYGLFEDLSEVGTWQEIQELLRQMEPGATDNSTGSRARRIWNFKDNIDLGDLVVMPRLGLSTIAIGEMVGEYHFRPNVPEMFHGRRLAWINEAVPREILGPDLRKSMNASGTVYQPSAANAEFRLRVIAETGREPESGDLKDEDPHWDAFIAWAKLFYEWDHFYEMERGYKLAIGEQLAAVKQAITNGDPQWQDLLQRTLRNRANFLTHWRVNEALLALELADLESALRAIWGLDTPLRVEDRVRAFQEFGPFDTPAVMASILLTGDDPTQYPMYRYVPLQDAFRLTGYPVGPSNSSDAWQRYEHALAFWDEFIKQANYRGVQIQDRLDAQSLVWCITQYGEEVLPENWPEDLKNELLAYRVGRTTKISPSPPSPQDPWSPPNIATLADDLLWEAEYLQEIIDDLEEKRQVIFYGPPGTGKTYVARAIAQQCRLDGGDFEIVQFHPSYSYEDFVEGFRPRLIDGQPGFELVSGPLLRIAAKARKRPGSTFVLVIDELNCGNVAKVFGELYFLLEYRGEEMQLQYGAERGGFNLPSNLWFICTMNTADRSIALMDAALRRRFYFAPFFPDEPPIKGLLRRWLDREGQDSWAADLVDAANTKLERDMGIGPSYFMGGGSLDQRRVRRIWQRSVLPYVEEQFFGDSVKLAEFNLDRLARQLDGPAETNSGTHGQPDDGNVPTQDGDDDAEPS